VTRNCRDCHVTYDDAVCWTCCPHERFISDIVAARKDAAVALMREDLVWAHQPDGPTLRIESISADGMVTLRGWSGEFSPTYFRVRRPF